MATTPAKRACSVCGTLLADDGAYCPVCALRGAVETQSDSVRDISSELRFEHYQVLRNEDGKPFELGHGGMGVTYKAIDTHLGCAVALKIIGAHCLGNENARSRFLREARAAASVRHSNVATVFHLGESAGNYFYAMEFVDGETLQTFIRRRGRLEIELALDMMTQVAAGLTAIHKQHLVHRDIKPSNIMLSWEERRLENVKIIDLGLAKGVTEDTLSIAGSFIGTPAYASPEQFAGLGADIRSDLYSLGVSLWEMLSGKPPFYGSAAELMDQHQHSAPPFEKLQDIPGPIMTLLEILLAKDPNQRFQTPAQLQQAITKVRGAVGSGLRLMPDELRSVSAEVTANVSKRKPRRTTVRWVLGVGLCLAGGLIAWFSFFGHAGFLSNLRLIGAAQTEKSIAVLPFESLSDNKNDSYFADGVQDEILANVARISQLKVISRTSVMQYRTDTKRDLRQIANALGVVNVLEGTVRRAANHVRITTELIDAINDRTIWSEIYDRDLSDIFAIQSEVAQTVADRLAATLSPEEKKNIEAIPTENLEAYDLYLQAKERRNYAGVFPLLTGYEKPMREAIDLLDRAIRLDPNFTLAYCASAEANDWLYRAYDPTAMRRALGDSAIKHALLLQPSLPDVHLRYANHLYMAYRDYERARVQLAIARRDMPNSPEAAELQAFMHRRQGNFEKAIQEFHKAISLDPRNPMTELPNTLSMMREFSATERTFDRAIALAPDHPILKVLKAYLVTYQKSGSVVAMQAALAELPESMANDRDVLTWHLFCALNERDWQKASALVEKLKDGDDEGAFAYLQVPVPAGCYLVLIARLQGSQPNADPGVVAARAQLDQRVRMAQGDAVARLLAQLAVVDALLGKDQDAVVEAKRALEMLPISKDAVDGPGIAENLAVVYAWTNELDLAFETLASLAKTPAGVYYGNLKLDPYWEPLRKDPRFDKLLAELAPRD